MQNSISYKMKYKIEKDQNTNTTLMHSHDDITFRVTSVDVWLKFGNHLKRVSNCRKMLVNGKLCCLDDVRMRMRFILLFHIEKYFPTPRPPTTEH